MGNHSWSDYAVIIIAFSGTIRQTDGGLGDSIALGRRSFGYQSAHTPASIERELGLNRLQHTFMSSRARNTISIRSDDYIDTNIIISSYPSEYTLCII